MLHSVNDPDKKITNSDEQDVAVNHSTKEQGGYDEPAPETSNSIQKEEELKLEEQKKKDNRGQKVTSGKIN